MYPDSDSLHSRFRANVIHIIAALRFSRTGMRMICASDPNQHSCMRMKQHYCYRYFRYRAALPVLALIFVTACGQGGGGNKADTVIPVLAEGYLVQPGRHAVSIRSTGDLLANEEVEIKAPVAGNVRSIHFREGQQVQRGALLVEIDNRSWVAQKKGLEARLISAESELGRKRKLLAIEGVSEEDVEQSVAEVNSSRHRSRDSMS
jgi:membrane fusion protein, multidrug efflux system